MNKNNNSKGWTNEDVDGLKKYAHSIGEYFPDNEIKREGNQIIIKELRGESCIVIMEVVELKQLKTIIDSILLDAVEVTEVTTN